MIELLAAAAGAVESDFSRDAAVGLAQAAGCDDLLIFARDPHTGAMIPVGLPMALPGRERWSAALESRDHRMAFPRWPTGASAPARVHRFPDGAFVLFGARDDDDQALAPLLRLLAGALRLRMRLFVERHRAAEADRSRQEAEEAAAALAEIQQRLDRANGEKRTLLRDLEQRVYERTHELATATQALESTVYALAHQLRSPVRRIDAAAYQASTLSPQLSDGGPLPQIHGATRKLGELIDGLVSIADLGRQAQERSHVDLSALAERLIAGREPGQRRGIRVQAGLRAYAFPELVERMLQHLLDNALRHTRGQQEPAISIEAAGEETFCVRDNGEGFDPAFADKLFRPFHTLEPSTRLGLGLAMCDRIARLHGGRMWAESAPGRGAALYFTLPGRAPSPSPAMRLAPAACTEHIIEAIADAVVVTDAELEPPGPRILFVNKAFENMTGWKASDILGRTPRVLQGPETDRGELGRMKTALKRGESFLGEVVNYRADGTKFILQWHVAGIRDSFNQTRYYVAIQRDITSERAAMREAVASAEAARARADELEFFAHAIAHDLRSPAAKIALFSEMCLKSAGSDAEPPLRRVNAGAQELLAAIDALYRFVSRPESRRAEIVDVTAIAHNIARALRRTDPSRPASIEIAEGLRVLADEQLVRAVLENLMSNAWKFASHRPKTRIEVGGSRRGDVVWIEVRDNGIGFDETLNQRLFRPFSRLVAKSEFEGTGLGLSIVKRLVSALGGEVTAHGQPGEGATFSFSLPAAD